MASSNFAATNMKVYEYYELTGVSISWTGLVVIVVVALGIISGIVFLAISLTRK